MGLRTRRHLAVCSARQAHRKLYCREPQWPPTGWVSHTCTSLRTWQTLAARSSTTDRPGLTTDLDHGPLGRPTGSKPAAGHGAQVIFAYSNAGVSGGPRVDIRQVDRNTTASLAKRLLRLDGSGRSILEHQRHPGALRAHRLTAHSGEGSARSVSEWFREGADTVHRPSLSAPALANPKKSGTRLSSDPGSTRI